MELRDMIKILAIVGLLAFYLGFVIRLLRGGRRHVVIPALEFSLGMLFAPIFFPYFLIILRKNKTLEQLVKEAMDDVFRAQEVPKDLYEGVYQTVLLSLSSPGFFLRCLGQLYIDYFRNWDKRIDTLVNTVPKRESPRLSFATTLIDLIGRKIRSNKIFHLGTP